MAAERRPTVLMSADTVGGVWTYAVDLAHALGHLGIDVHLATMGAPLHPHQRMQLSGSGRVTLHEASWQLEWMADPWDEVDLAGAWLLGLEQQVRPDVVHLNQFAFGALPFRAPTLLVAHSCVLSWWQAVHGVAAPSSWRTYGQRVALGLAGADLVAAPTQAMLDTLASNYGVDVAGMVLPNGRDVRKFAPGDKQPLVFAAGRVWDQAKNLVALDEAAAGLPWRVEVAGAVADPEGRRVQPRNTIALGELPAYRIAARMAEACIYAFPARYEPFGLSVLEAGLSGCALVLGDIPSLREVWGDAAGYVPPGDPQALRAALLDLIDEPVRRQRMAMAARERALRFTAERMADAYHAAYARLSPAFQPVHEEVLQCA